MKKRITTYLIAAIISLALPVLLSAQDPNSNQSFQQDAATTQPDSPAPPPPNDAPIDGGLTLLLAVGAAYGVKKYRDGKQRQVEEADGK